MAVLILFSIGVYVLFGNKIDVELQYNGGNAQQERLLEERALTTAKEGLAATLVVVDVAAATLAAVFGWFLAGRTLRPIERNFRRQRRFVSDAAHELRTPLSVMKAGLETSEAGEALTIEGSRELNSVLLGETNRLVELTNDLLVLAEVDSLPQTAPTEEADISEIAARETRLVEAYARRVSVTLRTDIESGLLLRARQSHIERLVLNLLKNAIDHNRVGGEVLLALKRIGGQVSLEVADTGPGISDEHLGNVFERFYKVDSARQTSGGGFGLGLAIVRDIVETYGAQITIDSTPGEGTTVSVTFR